jgi:hypothetical protein
MACSSFRRILTCPHPTNGSGVMITTSRGCCWKSFMNRSNCLDKFRPYGHVCFCFLARFSSRKAKSRNKWQTFQLAFGTLKSKLLKKWTKSWKAHIELLFRLLVCRNTKYILQKPTPKIKQSAIQLVISQLFQKFKSKNTNKQGLSLLPLENWKKHVYKGPREFYNIFNEG